MFSFRLEEKVVPKILDIWNEETEALLIKLWNADVSIPEIVRQIPGSNETSVRNKAMKLGLAPRRDSAESRQVGLPPKGYVLPADTGVLNDESDEDLLADDVSQPEGPTTQMEVPAFKKVTILELTESTCKWPVGNPGKPDFFFCGRKSDVGIPYCAFHARIAYQPGSQQSYREKYRKAAD
jgi:GcrA cell cycle regulator